MLLILSIILVISSFTAFGIAQNCNEIKCGEVDTRIHDIQGAVHESSFSGYYVTGLHGIVTANKTNGFYMQDYLSDCRNATSEGLFIFTEKQPAVKVGDCLQVSGTVYEYQQDESLSLTEIKNPSISNESNCSTPTLPPAVIIGEGGRIQPDIIVDDDNLAEFDVDYDGADFYESLEGMRVQINDALVLSPTETLNEGKKDEMQLIYVLADNGKRASIRSARGGVLLRPVDVNPERIAVIYKNGPKDINAGDKLKEPLIGVLTYDTKGNRYQVETDSVQVSAGSLTPEHNTSKANQGELSIATFNVENLLPKDQKFKKLSQQIVFNLSLPDIIALEEVGDNSGKKDDSVVKADQTYQELINAIKDNSGVVYRYTSIDPLNNKDGGATGYNIRVGILYRIDRGMQLVDRPGGDAKSLTTIMADDNGKPHLSFSPGRIDPLNPAFDSSRKPLAAEFIYNNSSLFVIANHLNSKGGDQPIYGANQPPYRPTENQRHKQAQVIKSFVEDVLRANPDANVIVLGDLNDFQFSETINILKAAGLTDVIESLPADQQYTYIHEGNSQVLDHILLSKNLTKTGFETDVVHINSEFSDRTSDHDPVVVRIEIP
jgi:hypothetical protein